MKKISLFLFYFLFPIFSYAGQHVAFKGGEKLSFAASYRAALIPNTEMAKVVVDVKDVKVGKRNALEIKGNVKTIPFFKSFFDLDDTYVSTVDAKTLKPLLASSTIKEGKYRFWSTYTYDWNSRTVDTRYKNYKQTEYRNKSLKLTNESYDGFAMFYNLRSKDVTKMTIGKNYEMDLVLEDTIRTIKYKYLGKEVRTIKGLGKFNTLKFTCTIISQSGESFEDGTDFNIWVSDDKNKVPLYLDSPIKVGRISARLTSFKNLKHPLTSKIE